MSEEEERIAAEYLNGPPQPQPPLGLPLNSSHAMEAWRADAEEVAERAARELKQRRQLRREVSTLQAALDAHIASTAAQIEHTRTFLLEVVKQALTDYSAEVAADVHAELDKITKAIRSLRCESDGGRYQ